MLAAEAEVTLAEAVPGMPERQRASQPQFLEVYVHRTDWYGVSAAELRLVEAMADRERPLSTR